MTNSRKFASEFLGTAGLLAIVVGSGIMGEQLSDGNEAITLLANSIATGGGLLILIWSFIDISGAHFNPVVSLVDMLSRKMSVKMGLIYIVAQVLGAIAGTITANLMFELPFVSVSTKVRNGGNLLFSEVIATFGLIGVIYCGAKFRSSMIAPLVAAYILAAYWFTSSTSFANPAVTIARSLSDTFTGIAPSNILPFILAQILGATIAWGFFRWLLNGKSKIEKD